MLSKLIFKAAKTTPTNFKFNKLTSQSVQRMMFSSKAEGATADDVENIKAEDFKRM